MPETVYTDPVTNKRYKVTYNGVAAPAEAQIRDSLKLPRIVIGKPKPGELQAMPGKRERVGSLGRVSPPPDPLNLLLAPVAVPAMQALSTVGNSARNFAQGALAPGLARYDESPAGQLPGTSVLGNAGKMIAPIFSDIPGNVKAGARAVVRDDGDKKIGRVVKSLSPDTLAGVVYNLATAAGSDPLNFVLPGSGAGSYLEDLAKVGLKAKLRSPSSANVATGAAVAGKAATRAAAAAPVRGSGAIVGKNANDLYSDALFGVSETKPPKGFALKSGLEPVDDLEGFTAANALFANPPKVGGAKVGAVGGLRGNSAKPNVPVSPSSANVSGAIKPGAVVLRSPGTANVTVAGKPAGIVGKTGAIVAKVGKGAVGAFDAVNDGMRAVEYSGDLSAPLRQGLVLGITRPVQAAKAFKAQITAAVSEKAYTEGLAKIATRPNAPLYQKFGVFVPDAQAVAKGQVFGREELLAGSRLVEKIPGVGQVVKASDRAMTGYLSRLRADVFDSTAAGWQKAGIKPDTHPEEYKALADWINTTTGRGDLGNLEKALPVLNRVLGAPRYQASRLQTLMAPANYTKLPPKARALVLRDWGAFVGANVGLLSSVALWAKANPDSGVSVSSDPTASDFGTVRIKDTRVDMLGAGMMPWARLFLQAGTGQKNGKPKDRGEIAATFARGRLAPAIALPLDYALGSDITGQSTRDGAKPDPVLLRRFWFLAQEDAYDAVKQHGNLLGGALGGLAISGGGVSDWSKEKSAMQTEAERLHDEDSENDNQRAALETEPYWRAERRKAERKRVLRRGGVAKGTPD